VLLGRVLHEILEEERVLADTLDGHNDELRELEALGGRNDLELGREGREGLLALGLLQSGESLVLVAGKVRVHGNHLVDLAIIARAHAAGVNHKQSSTWNN